jgi:hypothetical protein
MPGFDRSGPRGQGPRTGGRRGDCAAVPDETVALRGVGRGGAPWGGGRGNCWGGRGGRWFEGRGRWAGGRGRMQVRVPGPDVPVSQD